MDEVLEATMLIKMRNQYLYNEFLRTIGYNLQSDIH